MPNIIHFAIPGFILLMMVEIYLSQRMHRDNYEARDALSSLAMGIGNQVFGLITKGLYILIFFWLYEHRFFTLGWEWWTWIFVFLADDFSYYVFHFASHKCRYFWASHVVHHSSKKYTLATALRQTWTGELTGSKVFWFWMPLVGFHPLMIFTMMAISLIYQFWIHTELIDRLPKWFEFIFNTPSHHRVHHSNEIRYLDKNHGGILIIWDRIFGTFKAEEKHPRYGIRKDFRSFNPFRIAFDEWIEIGRDLFKPISFRDKLRYVFGPPGWSHDGSRITTTQLQKSLHHPNEND